ncbi:MAG: macro domain-containing protein [Candidatus Stahlbacteria bacterium]|nr:macro domain-containing protein [Candidatus Stahlbacteria bacterium]
MEIKISKSKLEIVQGDIVAQATDAIVNAANTRLIPGGGVDGAIHRAAGPGLREECKKLGGCLQGEAKITKGYNLKARYVIHTVGPVYGTSRLGGDSGKPEDAEILKTSYLNSLNLAIQNNLKSISFPAISTGAFGYPLEEAAHISLTTVIEFLKKHPELLLVRFVLYSQPEYEVYKTLSSKMKSQSSNANVQMPKPKSIATKTLKH